MMLFGNVADIARTLQFRVIQTTPAAAAYWVGAGSAGSAGILTIATVCSWIMPGCSDLMNWSRMKIDYINT